MNDMFEGPLFAYTDPGLRLRSRALAAHNPPADVWFDADGTFHRRCVTDDPNPDCNGCRETGAPAGTHYRFTPPVSGGTVTG